MMIRDNPARPPTDRLRHGKSWEARGLQAELSDSRTRTPGPINFPFQPRPMSITIAHPKPWPPPRNWPSRSETFSCRVPCSATWLVHLVCPCWVSQLVHQLHRLSHILSCFSFTYCPINQLIDWLNECEMIDWLFLTNIHTTCIHYNIHTVMGSKTHPGPIYRTAARGVCVCDCVCVWI